MYEETIVLYSVKDPNGAPGSNAKVWSTTPLNGEGTPVEFVLPFGYELRKTANGAFIFNYITGDVARLGISMDGRPLLNFPGVEMFVIDYA